MVEKQKAPECVLRGPSTNNTVTNASKLIPASVPPNKSFPAPAELRPAPDDRGKSDLAYFRARPGVDGRKRLAFANEPPPGLERDAYANVAFISVRLVRDAAGQPATILREIAYGPWGRA